VNRGDVDALLDLVTDDFDCRPPSHLVDGIVVRGHAGARAWMGRLTEAWSEIDGSTSVVATAGEQAVIAHDVRLVGRDSGAPISQRFFTVYTLREGKAAAAISFPTEADALEAAGLRE
jgi:ketosteroid isomerase-like protein